MHELHRLGDKVYTDDCLMTERYVKFVLVLNNKLANLFYQFSLLDSYLWDFFKLIN